MSGYLLNQIATLIDDDIDDSAWLEQDRVFVNKHARIQFRIRRKTCIAWQEWFREHHMREYKRWKIIHDEPLVL